MVHPSKTDILAQNDAGRELTLPHFAEIVPQENGHVAVAHEFIGTHGCKLFLSVETDLFVSRGHHKKQGVGERTVNEAASDSDFTVS